MTIFVERNYMDCRLKLGEIWEDKVAGHRVGCFDASNTDSMLKLAANLKFNLAVLDPPYNLAIQKQDKQVIGKVAIDTYVSWSRWYLRNIIDILNDNASLYLLI